MYHYNEESHPQAVFIYERRRVREDGSSVTMALPWAKYKQSLQIQIQTFIQIQTIKIIQMPTKKDYSNTNTNIYSNWNNTFIQIQTQTLIQIQMFRWNRDSQKKKHLNNNLTSNQMSEKEKTSLRISRVFNEYYSLSIYLLNPDQCFNKKLFIWFLMNCFRNFLIWGFCSLWDSVHFLTNIFWHILFLRAQKRETKIVLAKVQFLKE